MFSEINGIEYNNTLGKEQLPVQLKQIAQPSMTYNHRKILLVDPHTNDVNNYYAGYVGRYYFFSDKVVWSRELHDGSGYFKKTVAAYQIRSFTRMAPHIYGNVAKRPIIKVIKPGFTALLPVDCVGCRK